MANQVVLGIDVDSTDVKSGEAAFARLTKQLHATQVEMDRLTKASAGADSEIRKAAKSQSALDAAGRGAAAQVGRLNGALSSTAGLARAVQGAFAAFLGVGMIRSLMDTTMQLQKIGMTFQAVAGSSEGARAQMDYVTKTADKLGQSVLVSAEGYAKLLAASSAAGMSLQSTRNVFEGLTAAATAYGLSQYELEGALNAVQQMISKGSVQAEELRGQLGERLPGAFAIAAKSMNMTTQELSKAMELGKVSAQQFVEAFGPELQRRFGGIAQNAQTSGRAINELDNAMLALKKSVIDGGFQAALIKTLDTLTEIVASREVVDIVRNLGAAFKFMSENAEIAALSLGIVASAVFGIPGIIAGIVAAIALWTQRTQEIGDEHVKNATIIQQFWAGVVTSAKAAGELVVAVWDYIAASAAAIPARLNKRWNEVKSDFFILVKWLTEEWAALMQFLSDNAAKVPVIGEAISKSLADNAQGAKNFAAEMEAGMQAADAASAEAAKGLEAAGTAAMNVEAKFAAFQAADAQATLAAAQQNAAALTHEQKIEREKLARLQGIKDETDKLTDSTGSLGKAMDTAGKKSKKMADEFASANKVLEEQRLAYNRAGERLAGGVTAARNQAISEEVRKLEDALKDTGQTLNDYLQKLGLTRGEYERMLGLTYDMNEQWEKQKGLVDGIADGLKTMSSGDLVGGGTSIIKNLSEALFGPQMDKAFHEIAEKFANTITKAVSGTSTQNMTPAQQQMYAGVGSGIATAAAGALNEDSVTIGTGIGQAAGAVIGSIIPGVGTVIGGMIGSIAGGGLAKALGGGSEFKKATGVAFEGTPYERTVTTSDSVKVGRKDLALEGRFAFQAVKGILGDFQGALTDYVKATGGTVEAGTKLVVNQQKALKDITGAIQEEDIKGIGKEGADAGKRIQERMAEIMAIAGLIVQKAEPPLTAAQALWRDAQKKFSAENVAILRDLGLSVRQITEAKKRIQDEIRSSFDQEMANSLVDTGHATRAELDKWKALELQALNARRAQALATAKEIGGDVDLVMANFAGQRTEIVDKWKEMVDALLPPIEAAITNRERWDFSDSILDQLTTINEGAGASASVIRRWYDIQIALAKDNRANLIAEAKRLGISVTDINLLYNQQIIAITKARDDLLTQKARDAAAAQVEAINGVISKLNDKMKDLISQRNDVMQELTKRANEARQAEEALADARAGFATSALAPGGPLDTFKALQDQFNEAATKARGGDAGAATDAARLAQQLLEAGRNVFGSTTGYSDLFRDVNKTLTGVQGVFDKEADRIEAVLDKETFADVTEKSTSALLKALGALDVTMGRVQASIDAQTAKLATENQKAKVA